jgi:hypothetical protein
MPRTANDAIAHQAFRKWSAVVRADGANSDNLPSLPRNQDGGIADPPRQGTLVGNLCQQGAEREIRR